MKKSILLFLLLPLIAFGQVTFSPDTLRYGVPDTIDVYDSTNPFFLGNVKRVYLEDTTTFTQFNIYGQAPYSDCGEYIRIVDPSHARIPFDGTVYRTVFANNSGYASLRMCVEIENFIWNCSSDIITVGVPYTQVWPSCPQDSDNNLSIDGPPVPGIGFSVINRDTVQFYSGERACFPLEARMALDSAQSDSVYISTTSLSSLGLLADITAAPLDYSYQGSFQEKIFLVRRALTGSSPSYAVIGQELAISVTAREFAFDTTKAVSGMLRLRATQSHGEISIRSDSSRHVPSTNSSEVTLYFYIPDTVWTEAYYDLLIDSGMTEFYGKPFTGVLERAVLVRPDAHLVTIRAFYDADADGQYTPGFYPTGIESVVNSSFVVLPENFVVDLAIDQTGFSVPSFYIGAGPHTVIRIPDSCFNANFDTLQFIAADTILDWPLQMANEIEADILIDQPRFKCTATNMRITPYVVSHSQAFEDFLLAVIPTDNMNGFTPFDTTGIGNEQYYVGDTMFWVMNDLAPNLYAGADVVFPLGILDSLVYQYVGFEIIMFHVDSVGTRTVAASRTIGDTVVCSYDPNDKLVFPSGDIRAGDTLVYTIRFQNMGTDTAYNVFVVDTLDPMLDLASFQILGASHLVACYRTGNALEFRFRNIYLPDSTTDSTGSNGYVIYRAVVSGAAPLGYDVLNTAHIRFDNGPWIFTNTTTSHIPDTLTSWTLDMDHRQVLVYPNPGKEIRVLFENADVRIFDAHGRLVHMDRSPCVLKLPPGVYFYEVDGHRGKVVFQ